MARVLRQQPEGTKKETREIMRERERENDGKEENIQPLLYNYYSFNYL